jgi:hypothetical protein
MEHDVLLRIAELLKERNRIDDQIAEFIDRPMTSGHLAIYQLQGSVVFDVSLADPGDPPTMAAGADQLAVPLIIRHTARGCDAHVLGETKQPFRFPFFLTFDGGDPQYGEFDVSPEQQDALWDYIREVCPDG